jgi:hypothetical protein
VNTIRTPRQGRTQLSRRIARAVDDENWQLFRVSMKGKPTKQKLEMLQAYWQLHMDNHDHVMGDDGCDYCIRVDNYIKALSRGGQLHPGESLVSVSRLFWRPRIKRD